MKFFDVSDLCLYLNLQLVDQLINRKTAETNEKYDGKIQQNGVRHSAVNPAMI